MDGKDLHKDVVGFTNKRYGSTSPNNDHHQQPQLCSDALGDEPGEAINMGVIKSSGVEVEHEVHEDREEEEEPGPCGWGPIQPQCCQRLRDPRAVLFLLCCVSAVQGMVINGFVSVVITTIERRFDMASSETGFIASGYDVASVICLVPVSYFGGLGHKPRWLGIGVLLLGMGSIMFALPHFTTSLYQYDTEHRTEVCVSAGDNMTVMNESLECSEDPKSGLPRYKYMFIFAQLFHGVGATPLFTLGVAYLDENLKPKVTPVYTGIFYGMAIIGPAIGYVLGGEMLTLYCDLGSVDLSKVTLSPEDPQWVGAWWLGFLFIGLISIVIAVPMLGFPKTLLTAEQRRANRISEAYRGSEQLMEDTPHSSTANPVKEIPAALKVLLTNPTFMALCMAGAAEGLLISGFTVFTPKFVESQFGISASWAAQVVGFVTIPAGGGGTFLGGYIIKRFDLKCAAILKMCLITSFTALVLTLSFLVRCSNASMAGLNIQYGSHNITLEMANLTASCNNHCDCPRDRYMPVCGADNIIYFSPCFAGCSQVQASDDNPKRYSDCGCVSDPVHMLDGTTSWPPHMSAVEGKCNTGCQLLGVFLLIFALIITFTFATSMPALSATLRCVPQKHRSFALGIQWILARCLGTIPAPILFGTLIDKTCLLWQELCGETGSCFIYDNRLMGTYLLALAICCKTLSVCFLALALVLYKPPVQPKGQDLPMVPCGMPPVEDQPELHGRAHRGRPGQVTEHPLLASRPASSDTDN